MSTHVHHDAEGDFTQGSVLSQLIRISTPLTLALLVNVLYSVVDRMYIGHIPYTGRIALTGIGLAFPITVMVSAFQNLCSTGGAPLFSIARGKGNEREAELILGNAYAMLLIFGVLLTFLGYLLKEKVLWLTGASGATFDYANDYLDIYLLGSVFVLTSLGMNPFISAQGYAGISMCTVSIGAIINIILDPIFIFVFHMGVRGAALATIIAQFCSALWVLLFLTGKKAVVRLQWRNLYLRPKLVGRIMALGVTGFTFQVTNSAMVMIYNMQLQRLGGDIWVSAMTVISSLREILYMPIHGVTSGAQPIIGYNYGAHIYSRVRECIRLLFLCCLIYLIALWAIIMAFPTVFIRIFNNELALMPVASSAIRWFFCLLPAMALQMTGQNVFIALGRSKYGVSFSLLRKVVLVIPLAMFLPLAFNLGVAGVFLSEPISELIGGTACYVTMQLTVGRQLKQLEQ